MSLPPTESEGHPVQPVQPVMAPAAPGRRSASLLNVLLAVAVLVAVGGVSFAVGRATAPAPTFAGIGNDGNLPGGGIRPNGGTGAPGGAGGGFGGGFGGGLTLRGTVTAVDAGTVTIELTGGASVTVSKDGTTTYHQSVTGASTDVVIGKKVEIQLGSFDRTGNGAPGSQATGPVGTATNITVVQ